MLGNVGGLISTWSYVHWDAPDYFIGHGLNLATMSSILVLSTATYFWMNLDNKKRQEKESRALQEVGQMSMAEVERLDYKHPEFRWRP